MTKSVGLKLGLAASLVVAFAGGPNMASAASIDTTGPIGFESPAYSAGSINGQNGWSSTGTFDHAVSATDRFPTQGFDAQSLRISNATTSGSFGDQTFSPSVADPAGETTPQRHYDATFQIGTALAAEQPGLRMAVSPDDGNGARMSYLRFEDKADGTHVFFDDVTDVGPLGTAAEFNEKDIATLDRATAHKIRFSIDFYTGPGNDVAKIYIDDTLKHTGTTWENYYHYDPEAAGNGNNVLPVAKLLFRTSGTAAPDTKDAGFLVDNLTHASSVATAPAAPGTPAAEAEDGAARVSWTAPSDDGGADITSYTVAASPGGKTVTTTGLATKVSGLTNGIPYTFTVIATNETGTSPASAPSDAVTPAAAAGGAIAPVTRLSDFNRDGRTDLVARDGAGRLWLYPGNGAGSFLSRRQIGVGWNAMTAIITPGDVTGDNNSDLLAKDSMGRLWLYAGNGTGGVIGRRQIGAGWQSFTVTNAANLNGTGRPDLLARDSAGSLWLYPLSGNAVFGTRTNIGRGWNGYTIQGPGDVSGDRNADITARDTAGSLWLYRGNGLGSVGGRTLVSTKWQTATDLVTPGNWNGAVGNDLITKDAAGNLWLSPGDNAGHVAQKYQIGNGWQGMSYIG